MTRQEAINVLQNDVFNENEFDKVCDALEMAIEALEQEPDWIPVSERLPEIGDTVIISGKMRYKDDKDYDYFVDVAVFEPWKEFSPFCDWYEGQDEYVMIAWQPLPEPYEEA